MDTNVKDGIVLINKPAGMSSFGVVARVRRILSQSAGRKVKIGHTGTLDPFATGLMILVIGKECKNASYYTKLDKVYDATIQLGQTSTSGDPEGDIVKVSAIQPSRVEVEHALDAFKGTILQRPPIFSAIKVNGQRAYALARKGEKIEIPVRQVTIHSLEVLDYTYPFLKIRANVSSGTYIRSLAGAIGEALHVGAYCTQLRRLSIGKWHIEDAKKLGDFGVND